jgi:alkylation response protein AidB-like acyl-CoA dehydrogenase
LFDTIKVPKKNLSRELNKRCVIAKYFLITVFANEEKGLHNPANIATAATLEGDFYAIHGSKTFVLDGHVADKFVVVARVSGVVNEKEGIQLFLVEANSQGVSVNRTIMLYNRNSAKINFSKVSIPKESKMNLMSFENLEKKLYHWSYRIGSRNFG